MNVTVKLDPLLLEILACPCPQHAPLRQDVLAGAPVLVCTSCNLAFPVRDEIPVMLLDEATPFVPATGTDADSGVPGAGDAGGAGEAGAGEAGGAAAGPAAP